MLINSARCYSLMNTQRFEHKNVGGKVILPLQDLQLVVLYKDWNAKLHALCDKLVVKPGHEPPTKIATPIDVECRF